MRKPTVTFQPSPATRASDSVIVTAPSSMHNLCDELKFEVCSVALDRKVAQS